MSERAAAAPNTTWTKAHNGAGRLWRVRRVRRTQECVFPVFLPAMRGPSLFLCASECVCWNASFLCWWKKYSWRYYISFISPLLCVTSKDEGGPDRAFQLLRYCLTDLRSFTLLASKQVARTVRFGTPVFELKLVMSKQQSAKQVFIFLGYKASSSNWVVCWHLLRGRRAIYLSLTAEFSRPHNPKAAPG